MNGGRIIDKVPAIVAFVLAASVVALLSEIFIAEARGQNADPIVVGGLFTLIGSCITALLGFWLKESSPKPPDPPPPRRPAGQDWDEDEPRDRPGWLESRLRKVGRWNPCFR